MVSSSNCGPGANLTTSCSFTITNLGASNTHTVPTVILYITQGNQTRASVDQACVGNKGNVIVGGSNLQLSCNFNGTSPTAGITQVVGVFVEVVVLLLPVWLLDALAPTRYPVCLLLLAVPGIGEIGFVRARYMWRRSNPRGPRRL